MKSQQEMCWRNGFNKKRENENDSRAVAAFHALVEKNHYFRVIVTVSTTMKIFTLF